MINLDVMAAEFYLKFQQNDVTPLDRLPIIQEEVQEYLEAINAKDSLECYDALLDIIYATMVTLKVHNFDIDKGLEAVHASNMSKDYKPLASSNKLGAVKGASYIKPKLVLPGLKNPKRVNWYDNLILEGPDGCGKTTLAKKLAHNYQLEYIHAGKAVENKWDSVWRVNLFQSQLNQNKFIFDRNVIISELVYGEFFTKAPQYNLEDLVRLNNSTIVFNLKYYGAVSKPHKAYTLDYDDFVELRLLYRKLIQNIKDQLPHAKEITFGNCEDLIILDLWEHSEIPPIEFYELVIQSHLQSSESIPTSINITINKEKNNDTL